jgi:hypothetical protein
MLEVIGDMIYVDGEALTEEEIKKAVDMVRGVREHKGNPDTLSVYVGILRREKISPPDWEY